jgi:hypothetical protein
MAELIFKDVIAMSFGHSPATKFWEIFIFSKIINLVDTTWRFGTCNAFYIVTKSLESFLFMNKKPTCDAHDLVLKHSMLAYNYMDEFCHYKVFEGWKLCETNLIVSMLAHSMTPITKMFENYFQGQNTWLQSDVQRTWCKLTTKNKFIYAFVIKFSLLNIYKECEH